MHVCVDGNYHLTHANAVYMLLVLHVCMLKTNAATMQTLPHANPTPISSHTAGCGGAPRNRHPPQSLYPMDAAGLFPTLLGCHSASGCHQPSARGGCGEFDHCVDRGGACRGVAVGGGWWPWDHTTQGQEHVRLRRVRVLGIDVFFWAVLCMIKLMMMKSDDDE